MWRLDRYVPQFAIVGSILRWIGDSSALRPILRALVKNVSPEKNVNFVALLYFYTLEEIGLRSDYYNYV